MAIKQAIAASGNNIQGRNNTGKESNLLHLAIKSNLPRTVEHLIKTEIVSPNQLATIQSIKQPALCLATRLDLTQLVQILLSYGAKTNVIDSSRMSPLHLAAKNDSSDCVKLIHAAATHSDANFDSHLNQKDADGQTPLILAIRKCKRV